MVGADGRAEALKEQKNRILASKHKAAMYEVANVLKKKDFQHIDKAAQKSIKDVKKKLRNTRSKPMMR